MKKLGTLLFLVLLAAIVSCTGQGETVARVGSSRITREEFKGYVQNRAQLLGVRELTPEQKKDLLDDLIQREVVYLYAVKSGIKPPADKMKEKLGKLSFLERFRQKKNIEKDVLLEYMREMKSGTYNVSEKEIRDFYGRHREEFSDPEMYKLYLVRVRSANAGHVLREARKDPKRFDDMALKRESKDLRKFNGNAPFAPAEEFPPEMRPSLASMRIGEIGGPVKVKKGIFLYKLVDRKRSKIKPLPEVYMKIEHIIRAQRQDDEFEKWYEQIKKDFRIEINEKLMSDAA